MRETKQSHDGVVGTRSRAGGTLKRFLVLTSLIVGLAAVSSVFAAVSRADTVGPITFEPTGYVLGNVDGQQGWTKSGAYDVSVASVAAFPAAAKYGFGTQALRLSDAVTSGGFGDQTFSPAVLSPAGESLDTHIFDASFKIGTTQATLQPGLHLSVSPDNGAGARMSYVRLEDQADGVHLFFDDVTDAGPIGTVANFNETDIATLSRSKAHTIRFLMNFKPGPGNDVVKVYVDGRVQIIGTSWEDYYRYDPEAAGNGNQISPVAKLLFRESGTANAADLGNGFLVDNVTMMSATHFDVNSPSTDATGQDN
jgi:hypothetical protein